MLLHSYYVLSNAKVHRSLDIIPSSYLDVKVMHFLYSVKVDTELILAPLKKIGIPLLRNLRLCNFSVG